jgi:predicted ferric reductase
MMFLGKLSALTGLSLFLANPLLGTRIPFVIHVFGGMDKMFKLHKLSGKAAFYLLLCHPFALAIGGLTAGVSFGYIWNWTSLTVILGIVGLLALAILTGVAIYAHITHQRWVKIHRLFGWLIPLFMAHALLSKSELYSNSLMLGYTLTLGACGFTAFLYRSVLASRLIKQYVYIVAEVNHLEGSVTEIVLRPNAEELAYQPGQFAFVSFRADGIDPEAHPYSFTTANNGPLIRFAVKALGDDTSALRSLPVGSQAYIEGPYGSFGYAMTVSDNQVWIAGGVGITPFLSMARSLTNDTAPKISLFYASQRLTDAAFVHELIDITRHLKNFTLHLIDSEVSGFVTPEMIRNLQTDIHNADFLICGPPPMMQSLRVGLSNEGVATHRIHTEDFSI